MNSTHHYEQLIEIFNSCFADEFNTRLIKGDDEPIYLPADAEVPYNRIVFAHGFYASAIHEISHWCIAGKARRELVDFGYWYCPDGRDARLSKISPAAVIIGQGDYLSSLILAIYALRNQLTDEWPQYPGDEIKQIVEHSGLFLGDNAVRTLTGLIEKQHQQAQVISADHVLGLLQRVPGIASLNIIDTQLVENITEHLLRCLAAPVWIAEHRQSSMNNLKAAWPAAFDMSLHFITLLREQLDIPLFDSDLIGLYFACALERHQNERQPIILLSDQNAIATINQLAIERDVLNCRVIIARSLSELVAIREEIEPLLIINNSHYLLEDAVNNYITVKNIITAAGIEQIKHFLATAFIRQQPERFFSAPGSFHYSNVRGESWQHITRQICAQLVAQHHITADEAQRIIAREGEGENLIVNRLAIPHCWSEQERRFRGFFITLTQPVEVNNEVINHVLIACAAADARHELKIFSYLASVLCQHPAETIVGLTGYEGFMALLRQG